MQCERPAFLRKPDWRPAAASHYVRGGKEVPAIDPLRHAVADSAQTDAPEAAGSTVVPNRAKSCGKRPFGLQEGELKSGSQKRKSPFKWRFRKIPKFAAFALDRQYRNEKAMEERKTPRPLENRRPILI